MIGLPVHDVVGVAVVDTLEDLLHEDRGILLSELASGDNLVEKLSTLTNPIKKLEFSAFNGIRRSESIKSSRTPGRSNLLSYNVVALLVLKELVHLHNVGMVLKRDG